MITLHHESNITLVDLPERIVFANAEQLKVELRNTLEQGYLTLALNLSKVDFIDSSGLAVLVATLKRAEHLSGQIILLSPSHQARMLIELTRLHQIFDIYEHQQDLLKAFGQQAEAQQANAQ